MFSRQHFNAIAKDIRTELEPLVKKYEDFRDEYKDSGADVYNVYGPQISSIANLALRFAKRFNDERKEQVEKGKMYEFDPLKFMDACSPNKEKYPFSELWEAYNK